MRESVTPEIIALALVVALGVSAVGVFATLQVGSVPASSPVPTIVAPSEAPPSAPPTPTLRAPTPQASASPSAGAVSPSADVTVLLEPLLAIDDRLLGVRSDLSALLAQAPFDPTALAVDLRELAATATQGVQVADALLAAGAGSPASLLRERYVEIRDSANETLRASTTDTPAYQGGGTRMIGLLDSLQSAIASLDGQLPAASESPGPTPSSAASPTPSSGSASTSPSTIASASAAP